MNKQLTVTMLRRPSFNAIRCKSDSSEQSMGGSNIIALQVSTPFKITGHFVCMKTRA